MIISTPSTETTWKWHDARQVINATVKALGLADDDPHFTLQRIWIRYASVHCGGYEVTLSGERRGDSFYSLSQLSEQICGLIAGARRYTARWWQL